MLSFLKYIICYFITVKIYRRVKVSYKLTYIYNLPVYTFPPCYEHHLVSVSQIFSSLQIRKIGLMLGHLPATRLMLNNTDCHALGGRIWTLFDLLIPHWLVGLEQGFISSCPSVIKLAIFYVNL